MKKLEDFEVNICGDFYELLVILDSESLLKANVDEILMVSDSTRHRSDNDIASLPRKNSGERTSAPDVVPISDQILGITGSPDFSLKSEGMGIANWDSGCRSASAETTVRPPSCTLLNLKFSHALEASTIDAILALPGVMDVIYLEPVLPTHSSVDCSVPYSTAADLMAYAEEYPIQPLNLRFNNSKIYNIRGFK